MDLPEISGMSKAAVEAAMDLFKKLAGPVFEEFGGLLQDQVKFWRFKNGVRILQKAKRFLDDAGVSPQQVSLKVLISSFGDGSLEEDEAMQDRWASLLANAADPNSEVSVLPSFAEILKELSPKEAAILDTLFIHATPLPPVNAKKPYSV